MYPKIPVEECYTGGIQEQFTGSHIRCDFNISERAIGKTSESS